MEVWNSKLHRAFYTFMMKCFYTLLRIKRHLIALYLNGAEVQHFTQWEYNNA